MKKILNYFTATEFLITSTALSLLVVVSDFIIASGCMLALSENSICENFHALGNNSSAINYDFNLDWVKAYILLLIFILIYKLVTPRKSHKGWLSWQYYVYPLLSIIVLVSLLEMSREIIWKILSGEDKIAVLNNWKVDCREESITTPIFQHKIDRSVKGSRGIYMCSIRVNRGKVMDIFGREISGK